MTDDIIRKPRGQRVILVCDNPACRKEFSRDRSTYRRGEKAYCSRQCASTLLRPPYRTRQITLLNVLTPWFQADQPPIHVGLYRVQTKQSSAAGYFDAWWEDGAWWAYDERRKGPHADGVPFVGILRWRGRIVPPSSHQ